MLREATHAGFDDIAAGRYVDITSEEGDNAFWAGVNAEVNARLATRDT